MNYSVRSLVFSVALLAMAPTVIAGTLPKPMPQSETAKSGAVSSGDTKLVDINSATLSDLRSLPGIGTAYARKIVEGRPYASVDELKARKVLSNGIYDKIRDRISAKGQQKPVVGEKPGVSVPGSSLH